MTADYNGDGNYDAASASTNESVDQFTPTVSVSGSPNPATVNPEKGVADVTYTVDVSSNGSAPAPTGTVLISDGDGDTCTVQGLTGGSGSCVIAEVAGSYTVTAGYSGDGNYNAGSGTTTSPEVVDP